MKDLRIGSMFLRFLHLAILMVLGWLWFMAADHYAWFVFDLHHIQLPEDPMLSKEYIQAVSFAGFLVGVSASTLFFYIGEKTVHVLELTVIRKKETWQEVMSWIAGELFAILLCMFFAIVLFCGTMYMITERADNPVSVVGSYCILIFTIGVLYVFVVTTIEDAIYAVVEARIKRKQERERRRLARLQNPIQ